MVFKKVLTESEMERSIKIVHLNLLSIMHLDNTCINSRLAGFELYVVLIIKLHSPKDSKSIS